MRSKRRHAELRTPTTRGAAFVEAIIVIVSFTVLFLSMAFFRNVYLEKIRVARLARASLMAYSMGGCLEGQDPAGWASVDLDPNAGKSTPPPTNGTAPVPPTPRVQSKRGNQILGEMAGAGSDGTPLNPIAELGLNKKVVMTTTNGRLLSARKGFRSTMESVSFVSCGERMNDADDFGDIIHYVTDKFNFDKAEQDAD